MTLPALSLLPGLARTPLLAGCPLAAPSPPVCELNRAGSHGPALVKGTTRVLERLERQALSTGLHHSIRLGDFSTPCQNKEPSGDVGMFHIPI